ncbi:MAG: hypothetical protein ACI9DC_002581 [Gammaproteobacteria bacterium]|jgi:hypothetical protein
MNCACAIRRSAPLNCLKACCRMRLRWMSKMCGVRGSHQYSPLRGVSRVTRDRIGIPAIVLDRCSIRARSQAMLAALWQAVSSRRRRRRVLRRVSAAEVAEVAVAVGVPGTAPSEGSDCARMDAIASWVLPDTVRLVLVPVRQAWHDGGLTRVPPGRVCSRGK